MRGFTASLIGALYAVEKSCAMGGRPPFFYGTLSRLGLRPGAATSALRRRRGV